jgi:transcriptional regulator with XRE-family HTH domain
MHEVSTLTAAGLTQEELAERARLSVRTVSDLERGMASRPYRATVYLLAEALGLSASERATHSRCARAHVRLARPAPGRARAPAALARKSVCKTANVGIPVSTARRSLCRAKGKTTAQLLALL